MTRVEQIAGAVTLVSPMCTLVEAARLLDSYGTPAVVVVDGDQIVGLVTDRDVVHAVSRGMPLDLPVEDAAGLVMTTDVQTVDAADDVAAAAALLRRHPHQHLPVMAAGRVVGLLSLADVAASDGATLRAA